MMMMMMMMMMMIIVIIVIKVYNCLLLKEIQQYDIKINE